VGNALFGELTVRGARKAFGPVHDSWDSAIDVISNSGSDPVETVTPNSGHEVLDAEIVDDGDELTGP
jgi:hypothetical protein